MLIQNLSVARQVPDFKACDMVIDAGTGIFEVIPAEATCARTAATTMALGVALRKDAVIAGIGDVSTGNRLLHSIPQVAMHLVEEGTHPDALAAAFEACGCAAARAAHRKGAGRGQAPWTQDGTWQDGQAMPPTLENEKEKE